MRTRLLPWEYGVRNLFRRPTRSLLTLAAMVVVVLLVFVVVGFIRGLEKSLSVSGDQDVVLVYSMAADENIENSSIAARSPAVLAASLDVVQRRFGTEHVSPELYLGTRISFEKGELGSLGLVRAVTRACPLVRRKVQITEGAWPGHGEVIVGSLAHAKLGVSPNDLAVGKKVRFEGKEWKVAGRFTAQGSSFDSEAWCPLDDLQQLLKRQDVSLAAVLLKPGAAASEVEIFCKERIDLELQAVQETDYYASLQKHYRPVRILGWLVVFLVSGAGMFAGLNMMYGAVTGRTRELATLQAIGYRRRAIVLSLIQEATLLTTLAALIAAIVALIFLNGVAVRFTMGAFALKLDSVAIFVGGTAGLVLGVVGALPPAIRAMRRSIVDALKAV